MVAMGDQRAHAEFFGQGEGLSVVGFGFFDMLWIAPRRNVTEKVAGHTLRVPRSWCARASARAALSEGLRLLQAAGQRLRLPQGETTERLNRRPSSLAIACSNRLREQRHGVGDAPAQGICLRPRLQPSTGK